MLATAIVLAALMAPAAGSSDWISEVLTGIQQGHWRIVAALGMIGLVHVVRTYGAKLWKPLASGKYAVIVAVATSALAELGMAWYSKGSQAMGVTHGVSGALTGFVAAGLYRGAKTMAEKK